MSTRRQLSRIAEMQTEAIIKAALQATAEGYVVIPEIMVPLISESKARVLESRDRKHRQISSPVGPITQVFGRNDDRNPAHVSWRTMSPWKLFLQFRYERLTQMAYGLSRDDAGRSLRRTIRRHLRYRSDGTPRPSRVGKLMKSLSISVARRNPSSTRYLRRTQAIRIPLNSVRSSGWTTSHARRSAFRSRVLPLSQRFVTRAANRHSLVVVVVKKSQMLTSHDRLYIPHPHKLLIEWRTVWRKNMQRGTYPGD